MPFMRAGLCSAFSKNVQEKLNENGVKTIVDFITSDLEDLAKKCNLPYKDLVSGRRLILAQNSSIPVGGAEIYGAALSSVAILPTGSAGLDQILDGGIYTAEVTEIAGEIAAGKTQICFSTSVMAAGRNDMNVLFIDTCGSFSSEKIVDVLDNSGYCQNLEAALERIKCWRIFNVYEILSSLDDIMKELSQKTDQFYENLRLVVVDSIPAVISPVLGGQQTSGHCLMSHLGQKLKTLAVERSVAVLITNNLVHGEGGKISASLGPTWQHVPHTRIMINPRTPSDATGSRQAMVDTSTRLESGITASFVINDAGVQ